MSGEITAMRGISFNEFTAACPEADDEAQLRLYGEYLDKYRVAVLGGTAVRDAESVVLSPEILATQSQISAQKH